MRDSFHMHHILVKWAFSTFCIIFLILRIWSSNNQRAEASGFCRCKATLKIRLGIVVGFPFICYSIINSMNIYLDPAPMEFCHWLLCRSSRGCIFSHLHYLRVELQSSASISVWGTEMSGWALPFRIHLMALIPLLGTDLRPQGLF